MTNSPSFTPVNTATTFNQSSAPARVFVRGARRNSLLPANGDGSTLTLDFTTGVLDPRLTLTRAGNATFINSSGYVEWAAANNFTNSTFSGASGTTIPSWSFSQIAGSATVSLSGTELTITCTTATRARVVQNIGTSTGLFVTTQVKVTARSMAFQLNEVLAYSVNGSSSNEYRVNGVPRQDTFTGWNVGDVISLTCIPTNGAAAQAVIGIGANAAQPAGQSITITAVQAEPGTVARTVIPTGQSGSYQAPRFDYDPTTLAPRGLLIEGQTQNVLTNSNALTSSGWSQIGISSTTQSSSIDDPLGLKKAWIVEENTDSGFHVRRFSATTTAAAWTFSFWAKAKERDRVCLGDQSNGRVCATFVLTGDGTAAVVAGAGSPTNPTIVRYKNGWYRCSVTVTMTASTSGIGVGGYPESGTSFDGFGATFTGTSGNGVYLYGFQAELGTGASSYIPTGASAVTRFQDTASLADATAFGFDRRRGTLFFSGTQFTHGSGFARSVRLASASGTSEPMGVALSGTTFYGTARDANFVAFGDATRTNTLLQPFKFAVAFNGDTPSSVLRGSLNGSSVSVTQAGTAAPPTAAAVAVELNTNSASTNYASMAIRSVKFWPIDKSLSEITALTS